MEDEFGRRMRGKLGVTFDPFQDRIRIHGSTAEALGQSEYFRFLFNPQKGMFAVQACGAKDQGAERLCQASEGERRYVNSAWLVRYIYDACGWRKSRSRRAYGILRGEHGLVEFNLKEAAEIDRES